MFHFSVLYDHFMTEIFKIEVIDDPVEFVLAKWDCKRKYKQQLKIISVVVVHMFVHGYDISDKSKGIFWFVALNKIEHSLIFFISLNCPFPSSMEFYLHIIIAL